MVIKKELLDELFASVDNPQQFRDTHEIIFPGLSWKSLRLILA